MEGFLTGTLAEEDFLSDTKHDDSEDSADERQLRRGEKRKRKAEKAAKKERRLAKAARMSAGRADGARSGVLVEATQLEDGQDEARDTDQAEGAVDEVEDALAASSRSPSVAGPSKVALAAQPDTANESSKKKGKRKHMTEVEIPEEDDDDPGRFAESLQKSKKAKKTKKEQATEYPGAPTSPETVKKEQTKKKPRQFQDPGPQASADAGPSTSTPKVKIPRPKAPRASRARPSEVDPTVSQIEHDEELRRSFRVAGAMDAWLASRYIDIKELRRLEAAGIVTYKRGTFSAGEKRAFEEYLATLKQVNRMDDQELVSVIMGKGRSSERSSFPKFWPELAAQVPGRPVVYVKKCVQRMYDPRAHKGAWTNAEDDDLERAYDIYPDSWARIASIVDRTEQDCRDRWKNQLQSRHLRQTGRWTEEEQDELVALIRETNLAIGQDPTGTEAPWDIISEKMGGRRSRMQCRKKWQDDLRLKAGSSSDTYTFFQSSHRPELLRRIKALDVDSEEEINWDRVWPGLRPTAMRASFGRLKAKVPDHETKSFADLLKAMEAQLPRGARSKQIRRSPGKLGAIVSKLSKEVIGSEDEEEDKIQASGDVGDNDEDEDEEVEEIEEIERDESEDRAGDEDLESEEEHS